MSIVTKTGDKGMASLYKGQRLAKDNLRFEICGTLDELSSFLGLAGILIKGRHENRILLLILKDLFTIGTEAATEVKYLKTLKERISKAEVRKLEGHIDDFEKNKKIKCTRFIFNPKTPACAYLHISRAIARRAERRVVSAVRKKLLKNEYILLYLNRLSDLLFLIACKYK